MTTQPDNDEYAAAAAAAEPQGEAMRLFGKDPAFFVGVLEAALVVLLSFDVFGTHLSSEKIALIMAAVTAGLGFYTAVVTRDTLLGVGVGFAKAALALAAGYGLALTADQTSASIALVTILLGAFNHSQTIPLAKPSFSDDSPLYEVPKAA